MEAAEGSHLSKISEAKLDKKLWQAGLHSIRLLAMDSAEIAKLIGRVALFLAPAGFLAAAVGIWQKSFSIKYTIIYVCIATILLNLIYYMQTLYGKKFNVPRPKTRFTEIENDGYISIPSARLYELVVYMAELENWLEEQTGASDGKQEQ
jgi:hypothetical protein